MIKGFPRPMLNGLPLPYTSDDTFHGTADPERQDDCIRNKLCGVCGNAVGKEYYAVADRKTSPYIIVDELFLHKKCMAMSVWHCPPIRERLESGHYTVVCFIEKG